MGYKPQRKKYELEFEDYPGLVVIARSASLGALQQTHDIDIDMHEKDPEKRLEAFRFFVDRLVSWNIEHPETDDGEACTSCGLCESEALPPTLQSLLCLELDMVIAIIYGWVQAISRVSAPKGMSSSDGGRIIQEEVMSRLEQIQNPMRLPTPNLSSD